MIRILTAVLSLSFFLWPLLISTEGAEQASIAQAIFMVLMPLLVALLISELSSGKLNSRQIAVLGVLIALNSVIRLLGAGTAGIETIFFLILIAAYAFGPAFGYLLGAGSIAVSALISGGVGPWMPFQMMAAGLLGLLVGSLPKSENRKVQLVTLVIAAVFCSYLYGQLMTLWNWPFLAGTGTSISYVAGGPILLNLKHYLAFEVITGGLLWDTGRAITTAILVTLTAPALLTTLKRAARRAGLETLA